MNEICREELRKYEEKYHVEHSTGDLAPTVCALFGVPEPADNGGEALAPVLARAKELFGAVDKLEKLLIYCPDAVGDIHYKKHPELLSRVGKLADLKMLSSAIFPSVTPGCFCTIFSGSSPEVHGFKKWEQKLVTVETIFDILPAAGKSVAIVAKDSSIARIFRNRKIDYYTVRSDDIARRITERLIEEDEYDVIISYTWQFDHNGHHHGPDSPESLESLKFIVDTFESLVAQTEKHWKKYDRAVIFAPDHGNHQVDELTGSHGKDIPEDMLVNHFYRLAAAKAE